MWRVGATTPCRTTPVVEGPSVVVEHVQPERVAIAMELATASHHAAQKRPAATHAATQIMSFAVPTLVVECITQAPGAHSTPAPMNEHVAPALDLPSLLEPPVPDVPIVQAVQVPHMQIIEKIVRTQEILSGQDTKTSESLGTAPVRHVNFAEIVEVMEVEPPLPDESLPVFMTATVVDAPPWVVEDVQTPPVAESVLPASAVAFAALAPVVEDIVPTPAVTYAAEQTPVGVFSAPAPAVSHAALAPVDEHVAPAPAVTDATSATAADCVASAPAVTCAMPAPVSEHTEPAHVDGSGAPRALFAALARFTVLTLATLASTRMGTRAKSPNLATGCLFVTRSGSSPPGKNADDGSRAVGFNSVSLS